DQGEKLQEKRCGQDFAQYPTIFVDRLKEPGDVELTNEVPEGGAPRDEDDAPGPIGLEFRPVDKLRAGDTRIMNQRLIVGRAADEDEMAPLILGKQRKSELSQTLPVGGERARLERQAFGAAQDLGHAKRRAARLMADLGGVGGDLVKAQQEDERIDAR